MKVRGDPNRPAWDCTLPHGPGPRQQVHCILQGVAALSYCADSGSGSHVQQAPIVPNVIALTPHRETIHPGLSI